MEVSKIKEKLIEQKNMNLSGNLYHKNQLDFAYNTNHLEGYNYIWWNSKYIWNLNYFTIVIKL